MPLLRLARITLSLLVLLFLLAGCGGGGGGGGVPTPIVEREHSFSVDWAERSRAIAGPSAALSFRLTLVGADENGSDFTYSGVRGATLAAHRETYTFRARLRPITTTMRVDFYSTANPGEGAVVGFAQSAVNLRQSGNFVGNVNTQSTITSVVIPSGHRIAAGDRRVLVFETRDANGQLVAVTPGSVTWTSGNSSLLSFDGDEAVAGNTYGVVQVRATVNGVQSELVSVRIDPTVSNLTIAPSQRLAVGAQRTLTFTAAANGSQDVSNIILDRATWTSSNPNVLSFAGNVATGVSAGTAQVTVSYVNPDGSTVTSAPVTVQVGSFGSDVFARLIPVADTGGPFRLLFTPSGGSETVIHAGVARNTFSGFAEVPDGPGQYRYDAGNAALALRSEDIAPGYYSFIGTGSLDNPVLARVNDSSAGPAAGRLRVRFAAGFLASLPSVDVYVLDPGQTLAGSSPTLVGVTQANGEIVDFTTTGQGKSVFVTARGGKDSLVEIGIPGSSGTDATIVFNEPTVGQYVWRSLITGG